MKPLQQPFHVPASAYGIAIHPPDARTGKDLLQPLFALLRSRTQVVQVLAVALGTALRYVPAKTAVVAL